jgi:hypothetical protein
VKWLLAVLPALVTLLGLGWIFFMIVHLKTPPSSFDVEAAFLLLLYCSPGILTAALGLFFLTSRID